MLSLRKIIQAQSEAERRLARAIRQEVALIQSRARVAMLQAAIEAGDLERALAAAGIRDSTWSQVAEEMRNAYIQGGRLYAADAPVRLGFDFNPTNPRAQAWISTKSSELINLLNQQQIQVTRDSIRGVLAAGQASGQGPRTTALDLVGRINRATGRREGGLIKLTPSQAQYVTNARAELLSGNKTQMSRYLGRARRDRRFDKIVERAIANGEPVSVVDVNRMMARYEDRLLETRARTIARTETNRAFNEAADESLRQLVDEGLVKAEDVRRIWDATLDENTRESHAAAHGQAVGLDEPFIVGGFEMMHPGDSSLGADASETINCHCVVRLDINYLTEEAARG